MIRSFRKINLLLDRRQKLTMAGLVLVMLVGAILEALGITMIIPVLEAIIDPDFVSNNPFHMGELYKALGMQSTKQFAVTMMVAMVVIFAVKNIYLYFEQVLLLRFIYTNQFATSNRMMMRANGENSRLSQCLASVVSDGLMKKIKNRLITNAGMKRTL